MSENKKLVTFLDGAQRTIIGEEAAVQSETKLMIVNPVVVNIVPQYDQQGNPTQQLALQLLPVFFKEFLADKTQDVHYAYPLDTVTTVSFDCKFEERLYQQYEHTINPPVQVQPPVSQPPAAGQSTAPVVNLFSESEEKNNG